MEHITDVTGMALQAGAAEQLSLRINETQAATRRGLENAVPVSVAGLAAFAANRDNARELFRTIRRGSYPHLGPSEVVEPALSDQMASSSTGFLAQLFGGRLDDIVENLAAQSSVSRGSARMLLGLAAPLVLDAVGKEVEIRNLDAQGLSRFLADEGREASAALPSPLSAMVGGGMLVGVARPLVAEEARAPRRGVFIEGREDIREVDVESRARARRDVVAGPRVGDWWKPLLWLLAALVVVGVILFLVSRGRRPEAPTIRTTAPETTVPERAFPLTPPGSAPAPREQFARPPVASPESETPPAATAPESPPAATAPERPQAAAPQATPPATTAPETPPAATSPETPPAATTPETPPATTAPGTPPATTAPEKAAAPASSQTGELSAFLEGKAATPKRFPLSGVEFAVGSAAVSDPAMLDDVAKALADHPDAKIRLEGRTDPTGGKARNQALSRERAEAVKKQLVEQGVAADRIETKGMASKKPAGSKAVAQENAQERRVDLVVIKR